VARPFGASIRALLNLPATILMRLVSYLYHNQNTSVVVPGLVPGIHEFQLPNHKDVDGRDERGHDERTGVWDTHRLRAVSGFRRVSSPKAAESFAPS